MRDCVRAHTLCGRTCHDFSHQSLELEALITAGEVVVVDALPASYYDQMPPGALNLVEDEVDVRAAELLPDKDAAIVTYCSNASCGSSQAVANRLERLGYTNVGSTAGHQDWVGAGTPPSPRRLTATRPPITQHPSGEGPMAPPRPRPATSQATSCPLPAPGTSTPATPTSPSSAATYGDQRSVAGSPASRAPSSSRTTSRTPVSRSPST